MHDVVLPDDTLLEGNAYTLKGVLGRGGFGITYRALDNRLQRFVAIKEYCPSGGLRVGRNVQMPPDMPVEQFDRFRTGRLNHPNVVRVLAAFEENDTAYVVMEFITGQTLAQVPQRLPLSEALALARRLGAALQHVHQAGLLHRDVKPSNVMLRAPDDPVLVDFGNVRDYQENTEASSVPVATPGFAAPEQYAGHVQTPAVDVFGLAATVYWMLGGQLPPPALQRMAGVPLVPLHELNPDVSQSLSDAIERGMAMAAGDRPSLEDFLNSLGADSADRDSSVHGQGDRSHTSKVDMVGRIVGSVCHRRMVASGILVPAPPVASPSPSPAVATLQPSPPQVNPADPPDRKMASLADHLDAVAAYFGRREHANLAGLTPSILADLHMAASRFHAAARRFNAKPGGPDHITSKVPVMGLPRRADPLLQWMANDLLEVRQQAVAVKGVFMGHQAKGVDAIDRCLEDLKTALDRP